METKPMFAAGSRPKATPARRATCQMPKAPAVSALGARLPARVGRLCSPVDCCRPCSLAASIQSRRIERKRRDAMRAARQSRNRTQTSFNAETRRARSNAEEKRIFFLLSLRSSANLCVSALILRRLRANPDNAVQRKERGEGPKPITFQ